MTPQAERTSLLDDERLRRPHAVELARLASPAVVIEPELLRSLRLDLAPHLPVSAEADLWLGPLVSSHSSDGITLIARVGDALRVELSRLRSTEAGQGLVDRAWSIIAQRHLRMSPALALEERLAWLSISGARVEEIEQQLGEALRALATGRRPGLVGWAGDAWRRLPDDVKALPPAWVLRQVVAPGLRPPNPPGLEQPEGIERLDLSRVMSHAARVALPVWRDGPELVLGATNPADPIAVLVPDTDPFVVEVTVLENDAPARVVSATVAKRTEARIHVGTGDVRLRTLLGDVYEAPFPASVDEAVATAHGHHGAVKAVCLANAEGRLVSGSEDQTVRIWDAESLAPLAELRGHSGPVNALAMTPDGQIVSGGDDGMLRRWDLASGEPLGEPLFAHSGAVNAIALTPDGQIVSGGDDGMLRRWDLASGEPLGVPLVGHSGAVNAVALTPGGRQAVSASDDGALRRWDLASGEPLGVPLVGHSGAVNAVAVTPDREIVSAGDDGTLRRWSLDTGRLIISLRAHVGPAHGLAILSGGRRVASAGSDSAIRLWRLEQELRLDLVLEGGGVKAIALAGALRELDDRGFRPMCVAGTSGGAIIAALSAVGYSAPEIEQLILHGLDFPRFLDESFLTHFGQAGDAAAFLTNKGLHSGKYFLEWMRSRLEAKGITTFGQLRSPQTSDANREYRLQVIATDLTSRSMLVLPRDATQLGIDPDELEIALAVRMGMSIPVLFEPVIVTDSAGREHVIVDGSLLSNYPVWLFDVPGEVPPQFPTFGLLSVAPTQEAPVPPMQDGAGESAAVSTIIQYVEAIADVAMEARDRLHVEDANYARTVPIPSLGISGTEFGLSAERAQQLFQSGRAAAAQFLETWDFGAYASHFRRGYRA